MSGPKDPLGPPREDDPFWIPDDFPRFTDPTPAPAAPTPPAGKMACPSCGTLLRSTLGRHKPGDVGVCGTCMTILIIQDDGQPRFATFDEAEAWDKDPRVKVLRAIGGKPLPGPDGEPSF